MSLNIPTLSDKTYEELVDQATKRLPAYDDSWTDHNPSDPGIALLELFAYLTTTYTYQLDTITDQHRQKYLRLMGTRPQTPEPASIRFSLELPAGRGPATIPAGTKLTVIDNTDTQKVFETTTDVVLTDASVEAVVTDRGDGRTDNTQANKNEGMFYRAFGPQPEQSSAVYLGLDGDPFDGTDRLAITVDFHEDDLPEPATHGDDEAQFFPSVDIEWEYCVDYENAHREDAWRQLPVARDGTYALYRGGRIIFDRPEGWNPQEWAIEGNDAVGNYSDLYWVRCRIERGGYEVPPQFDTVSLNVVEADHRATIENELLQPAGTGEIPASLNEQRYRFSYAPVLEAEIAVDGELWEEVEDFDGSGPTDNHYVIDESNGIVRFGDGVNGRMPDPESRVVARRYVFGGGRDGNIPASSTWQFLDWEREIGDDITLGDVSVEAVEAGSGGTDSETIDEAFRRVKREMKTPSRAVTAEDYRYVATHTPGLRFGRASVLTEERSDLPFEKEPVEVTVVVVPYAPPSSSQPEPSEGFLEAVERHIDKYRLLTDRVTVEAPTYVGLFVDVEVQLSAWLPDTRVSRHLESTLEEYIHPIHGYDGEGWPFGQTLHSDGLVELLEETDFVERVEDLSIQVRGDARIDADGNVQIDESSLFTLDRVESTVRTVHSKNGG